MDELIYAKCWRNNGWFGLKYYENDISKEYNILVCWALECNIVNVITMIECCALGALWVDAVCLYVRL